MTTTPTYTTLELTPENCMHLHNALHDPSLKMAAHMLAVCEVKVLQETGQPTMEDVFNAIVKAMADRKVSSTMQAALLVHTCSFIKRVAEQTTPAKN